MCLFIRLAVFTTLGFVLADVEWTGSRVRRGVSMKEKSWTMPIPYTINNQYTAEQKAMIKVGIQSLMDNTCVDFNEDNGSSNRLEYKNLNKCSSIVGDKYRTSNRNHDVSLDLDCLTLGNVQHETMHALGFEHAQNRPDRDDYLTVNWTNIADRNRYEKNFLKVDTKDVFNYGIPYEFGSRMHYGAYDFGMNKLPVLIPKDKDYLFSMGTAKTFTFYDWKMLNIRYCNESCPGPNHCKNGGYQHPRDCSKCICTVFHEGQHCEIERGLVNLELLSNPEVLTFKRTDFNYDPVDFMNMAAFEFPPVNVIKAPANRRIRVTIEQLGDSRAFFMTCLMAAVEFADEDLALAGKKFCNYNQSGHSFVSKSNVIGLRIYSAYGKPFESRISFSIEPETASPTTTTTTGKPTIPTTITTTIAPKPSTTTTTVPPTTTTTTKPVTTATTVPITTTKPPTVAPATTTTTKPPSFTTTVSKTVAPITDTDVCEY